MEGEDHRFISGEHRVERMIVEAVRMFGLRLQHHQIDDIDHANADVGHDGSECHHRRHSLQRRHVTRASHDDIGIGLIARPFPDTGADGAVANRFVHAEPHPFGLLAGNDQVHIIAAAKAVVSYRQQAICVGRQIDARDISSLVGDMIDEPRILMRQAIMILPPDM